MESCTVQAKEVTESWSSFFYFRHHYLVIFFFCLKNCVFFFFEDFVSSRERKNTSFYIYHAQAHSNVWKIDGSSD